MSRSLGINNVAEGVETNKAIDILSTLNCEYGQGYYWAKPLSSTDLINFVFKQERK